MLQTVDSGGHSAKQQTTMTGFTTAYDYNIVVLAACQGKRNHVVNIGLGVKRLSADGVPVQQWAQSQQHKVSCTPGIAFSKYLIHMFPIVNTERGANVNWPRG